MFTRSPDLCVWTQRRVAATDGPPRIMVVDDSLPSAEALAAALSVSDFQVRSACGAAAALEVILDWRPHIFVLDINMPEYDGFWLARVLRRTAVASTAGIIAFTGQEEHQIRQEGLAAGLDGYCRKGTAAGDLVGLLQKLLSPA